MLAMIVTLVVCALLTSCKGGPDQEASAAPPKKGTCEVKQGLRAGKCRTVRLSDGTTVRYALIRSGAATERTTLVDLGGPGVSLFGAQWPTGLPAALPANLRSTNVLLIEEPWVTARYGENCRNETSTAFKNARLDQTSDADTLVAECGLNQGHWGWAPPEYRKSVAAIAAKENLVIEAFVGASFAARRLSYLGAKFETSLLVDPAPPGTYSASRYLADRRIAAFERIRTYACRGCSNETIARVLLEAKTKLQTVPVKVTGRSVEVGPSDVGAAAIAAGYQNSATVMAIWDAFKRPTGAKAGLIGRLSDSAWGRVGVEDLSPGWLAYLSEVCPAMNNWGAALDSDGGDDPALEFLRERHAPCAGVAARSQSSVEIAEGGTACVVFSKSDGVIAARAMKPWRVLPRVKVIDVASSQHGDLQSLDRCEK